MKLEFITKNYKASDRLLEVLQHKLDRLDKYFDGEAHAKVVMCDNNKVCKMEISVACQGTSVRSEAIGKTMYYSIDACMPKLERQIVRQHSRQVDKRKIDNNYMYVAEIDTDTVPITRVKQFDIARMTAHEAAQQLDMVDHDFYIFVNSDNDKVEVVYRRRDGDAGHLQPRT